MFTTLTAVPLQANTWFHSPGSILVTLGPLTIRYYGLMIALAFLAALYVMKRLAKTSSSLQEKQSSSLRAEGEAIHEMDRHAPTGLAMTNTDIINEIDNFAIVGLMLGLVGARLWFVILNFHYYLAHPLEIHQIWLGGQSIQGGLIGGVLGTWLYDRIINKRSNSEYLYKLSLIAVTLPLAQAIGRWGNFFNEEAFGGVTTLPWGLYISHTGHLHHPTFLYESLGNLIIFALMLRGYKSLNSSQVIGSYLILYSSLRLVIESLRTDSLMLGGMPAATVLSWGAIVVGIVLVIVGRERKA